MKAFQKLALAAAIASVPMMGMAMEPLNDETLAGVTGQDGITLGIDLTAGLNLNVYIEDTDGLQDGARDLGGLIAIEGLSINTGVTPIEVSIDAGSSAGVSSGGVLRLGVNISGLTIEGNQTTHANGFEIGVAGVDAIAAGDERDAAAGWLRVADSKNAVTNVMTIEKVELGGLNLDIELGPEASGMALSFGTGASIDEITLTNFAIGPDNAQVHLDEVLVRNIDLAGTTGQVTGNGLALTFGTGLGLADIALMGVKIGDNSTTAPAALGNIYVDGLDLSAAVITVSGH